MKCSYGCVWLEQNCAEGDEAGTIQFWWSDWLPFLNNFQGGGKDLSRGLMPPGSKKTKHNP